jgi:hypothetical protein
LYSVSIILRKKVLNDYLLLTIKKIQMKKILAVSIIAFFPFFSNAQILWAKKAGGYGYDYGRGISADNNGNFYMTGEFEYNSNFNGIYMNGYGLHDIFLAKYNSSGSILWVKKAGGTGGDVGHAVASDASGNAYITGEFEKSSTFGGVTISGHGYPNDVFVAKYNSSGSLLWVKKGGSWESDKGRGITAYGGNVFVTGFFQNTADFDGKYISSAGGKDIFFAKYDGNGVLQWLKRMGGSGSDEGLAITADNLGNIYVTGYFSGTANFSGVSISSSGTHDIFIAKYTAEGVLQWVKKAGGGYSDFGRGIAADKYGRVFVTGVFRAYSNFGGINMSASGDGDAFIACYNSSGGVSWVKKGGGSSTDVSNAVTIDGASNVYISGYYGYGATFGSTYLSGVDKEEIFVASYTSTGAFRWAKKGGGYADEADSNSEQEAGLAVSADYSGNLYCSGDFRSNVVLGTTTLNKYAHNDIFVTRIGPSSTGRLADTSVVIATISPTGPASFCNGQHLTLEAPSDSGYSYQWQRDGLMIPGASGSTYDASISGNYKVRIIYGSQVSWSAPVNLSVTSCNGTNESAEELDSLKISHERELQSNLVNSDNSMVHVYPNPGTGKFTIDLCLQSAEEENLKISVVNSIGQSVYEKEALRVSGCIKQTIDLDNTLPTGIYILQLLYPGRTETTKIILRR